MVWYKTFKSECLCEDNVLYKHMYMYLYVWVHFTSTLTLGYIHSIFVYMAGYDFPF